MSDSKKKIYLGEDLVCQTFTDAEEQAKAFDLFGLEQPVVSSNAPASTRPVQQGQVCEFDGVNDFILSSELIRPDLDVEIIFKVNSATGSSKAIFGGGVGSVRFYAQYNQYNGGTLHVVIGAYQSPGVLNSVTGVSEDVWHTLRMQSNGDWYLNGVFQANVGDAVTTTPANTSENKLNIGRRGDSTGTHSNISVASFKVLDDGDLSTQYNLNHASGTTAYDSSGNGNHGTLQNGAAFVVDNTLPPEADRLNLEGFNKRMLFDGVNDDVALPSDITGQITDVTGATWVGRIMTEDNSLSKQTIFSDFDGVSGGNNKGFMIRLSGDDILVNYLTSGGAWVGRQATAVVNSNTLTHITVTWSGGLTNGAFKIYVNGAQVDDADYSSGSIGAWQKSDSNYTIGSRYSTGGVTNRFKGIISDPSFYSEELSSADILDMYNGDAPDDTNLISQYEGHGNTDADWVDLVGTNDGTVNGSPENLLIPRDESDPTKDIDGNPLQYSGSVYPRRPEFRNSYAASFDGANDYVDIPDNTDLNITDNLSVFIRAKNDNAELTSSELLISKYDSGANEREWNFLLNSLTEKLRVSFGNGTGSAINGIWESDSPIDIENWMSYGFTFDGGVLVVYLDGVAISGSVVSGSIPSTIYNGTADLTIGSSLSSGSGVNIFEGVLSDARIYSTTILTPAEMLAIHDGTSTSTGATLEAHYPLTEGAGDTAHDISGNGNHGTINNASTGTEGAGFWAGRIDGEANALNNNNGFSLYENGGNKLRVPYISGAAISSPTVPAGYTLTSENPAITDGYNDSETELDAYNIADGDNPSPATNNNSALESIEFGADFASNDAAYMRLKSSTENDRLITFEDDLTGGDETLAQKYTQ